MSTTLSTLVSTWAPTMRTTAVVAYGASLRSHEYRRDTEAAREAAIDAVEELLFSLEAWTSVEAVDISDCAHDAVDQYERDVRETEATRAMIADMEDNGWL